jgi:hypothetical protein
VSSLIGNFQSLLQKTENCIVWPKLHCVSQTSLEQGRKVNVSL